MARESRVLARSSRSYEMDSEDHLYFGIGNQDVSAFVSPRAAIHRGMIFTGVDD